MTTTTLDPSLAYYARHSCALFPIPAGSKNPTGIVESFKRDFSTDPAQWAKWRAAHNCNFGIVAFASRLIIVDIDTKIGRDEAWRLWCELCEAWGIPVAMPQVQSARGGWHVYFAVPADIDPLSLRQPDAIKDVINIRCIGYTVAAGSHFEGLPYTLLSDAAPYPAPAALIEHCKRKPIDISRAGTALPGSREKGDVAELYKWLNEREQFTAYEDWVAAGMAAKLEYGDDGFALWELTFDETVTPDTAASKWESFASEPDAHAVTLNTFLDRAHKLGWKGQVRKSISAMFPGLGPVAKIAADAGATLSSGNGLVGNTQRIIANQGEPYITRFLESTQVRNDIPLNPRGANYPNLPANLAELYPSIYEAMRTAITRIVVMAESPKTFRQTRVMGVLGVLRHMHAPTCQALVDYILGLDAALSPNKLETAAKEFEKEINAGLNAGRTTFWTDSKNKPDPAISDNVAIFLALSDHRAQFDTFGRRVEVAHGEEEFVWFDQDQLDRLWLMAKSVDYNYHPSQEVFKTGIKVAAKNNQYDSLDDEVQRLSDAWDGKPRLDTWLTHTCNVENNPYHTIVGRNLIGGMVKRAREPGCKHDEVVIFISPKHGTGKSTIANILARREDWFLGKFKFGQSDQSALPLLAGKWVVELGELAGMGKTDAEDVKSFLSEKKDVYVAKYETLPTTNPRRCIFIGTSNNSQPLSDPTGNRRFLPVHVIGESNLEWLRANVDQLIGEAARRHAAGEQFGIPKEMWDTTAEAQESARTKSAVEEAIYDWFDREGAFYIRAGDIGRALNMAGLSASARYGEFMTKLGWHLGQVGSDRTRVWIKNPGGSRSKLPEGCLLLEPAQMQLNGRVEMRVRQPGPGTV